MKAMVLSAYNILQVKEMPQPAVAADELLIAVSRY